MSAAPGMSLLDVDDPAGLRRRDQQVGLTAQERGNLQHVGDFGRRRGVGRLVDVGQDRHADVVAHSAQTWRALVKPGPRNERTDVRLALSNDALKMTGTPHRAAMSRMARARPRACAGLSMTQGPAMRSRGRPPPIDQDRRAADRPSRRLTRPRTAAACCRAAALCWWLASTNPANSGCGFSGFDLNSGWNCTASTTGCDRSSRISTNLPSCERPTISKAVLGQRALVQAVEFVAVAVALLDLAPRRTARCASDPASARRRSVPRRIVPPRSSTPSRSRSL